MITSVQEQTIKRCQRSVTWFLRNFGKLKHPSAGIIKFDPFSYQKSAINHFRQHRLNIFKKCRQSGVSKIAGAFATWYAMFHSHKTILIVSRTNDNAMEFLRDHITFLYEHLPLWMQEIWRPIKQNEHELVFPNGSRIKSLTSHPDVLRSNASSLNIIDESAFIQGMDVMWAGGWPCSRANTLIQTSEGLVEVGDLAKGGGPWREHNIQVVTDDGFKTSDKAYCSGLTPTKIVRTYLGVELEGTHHHRVRVIDDAGDYVWERLDELAPDDMLISLPGQYKGVRQHLGDCELNEQLAEILGLYIGDGSLSLERPKRFKIVFDYQDKSTRSRIVDQFNNLDLRLSTQAYEEDEFDTANLRLNSAEFSQFMIDHQLNSKTKPQDAQIPKVILRSDETVVCAFLRGLFDSDGWCYQSSTSLKLGLSSASERLIEQAQIVLHALGIISRRYLVVPTDNPDTNDIRYSDKPYWRLDIWDCKSKQIFKGKIGFLSDRKQQILNSFESEKGAAEIDHPSLVGEFAQAVIDKMIVGTFRECPDKRKWNLYRIKRLGRVRLDLVASLAAEFDLDDKLSNYVRRGFSFDTVVSISAGECETFDISVPENNTYLANGLINHNTLQHGGNVICISTCNGVGGWYWSTWTDAEAGVNGWNAINIDWWDMDWVIEFYDPLSRKKKRIAPRDGLRKCRTTEELEKFGPYWSPWLQEQYDALQEQGGDWKFKQEILADFVGSGNTVLSLSVLNHITTTLRDPQKIITGYQAYVHPVRGEVEDLNFTFSDPNEGLWIWEEPVTATTTKYHNNIVVKQGRTAHSYVMGVDIATGKGADYSAIEIFDVDTLEQVAEFMAHCLPRELIKFIDRIGRWYNCALAVVERNNGGDIVIDLLRDEMMYPRLWRRTQINDKPRAPRASNRPRAVIVQPYGFSTSAASKPTLNKFLIDFIRDKQGDGYSIYSKRLHKQLQTYVRKRDRMGRDTNKTEAEEGANFDDLVIACGLALLGTGDATVVDSSNLVPFGGGENFISQSGPVLLGDQVRTKLQGEFIEQGGPGLLMPMSLAPDEIPEISAQRQLDAYTLQLGGIPMGQDKPTVVPPKFYYDRKN